MFFIDKYRPTNIKQFIFHKDIIKQLEHISKDNNIPNIIFYGPVESGKHTLVNLFLELIYDKTVHKTKDTVYNIVGSNGINSEIIIQQSNFHILIEPNNNNSDKYIVQDIIKEYAMRIQMNFFKTKKTFKIVLINNIQNLSYYAQTSLRRTMELYAKTCRFILISSSLSKVIEPLRSRCHTIRVNAPTRTDLLKLLVNVASCEQMKLSLQDYINIRDKCGRNTKQCLWELQNIKYGIKEESNLYNTIKNICSLIINNDIDELIEIRVLLYSLLITNINGTYIIKEIIKNILPLIKSNKQKYLIINSACTYEYRLIMGRHDIFHIEGFIIDIYDILCN